MLHRIFNRGNRTPARRRLQFSLLSLFVLTTTTCLIMSWWVWPQPVEVVSLVNASATPIPIGPASDGAFACPTVIYQQELLTALKDPKLLHHAVSVASNANLA